MSLILFGGNENHNKCQQLLQNNCIGLHSLSLKKRTETLLGEIFFIASTSPTSLLTLMTTMKLLLCYAVNMFAT